MAETSTSNSGSLSSSPINKLGLDHLFSILLILPTNSIACFGMTNKRFKSLAFSNSLWESLCRRDWGNSSVDALINSDSTSAVANRDLPWMDLYRQVYLLDSVSCYRLSNPPPDGNMFPGPRASHSLNFVSGCLVMFGGGWDGGRHLDDTWVAHIGTDFKQNLKWQKITTGIPSGRFGHSCVVVGDTLVLFGGINDHGIRQNDTWLCQLLFQEDNRITLSWKLLDAGPIAPPARGAHAGCCIDNSRKMLIHGGIGLSGLRLGDTWILEISENTLFGTWHEIVTHPTPAARSGHTVTYIGENRTILFGGRGTGYQVLNDVWLFDSSFGELKWFQLLFELRNYPGGTSLPRVGHSATLILGGRLLIYGGEDSYRHRKDDYWILDVNCISPSDIRWGPCGSNMWKKLKLKGYKPKCRSFHQACADLSGRYMYVFGGMVDGVIHPGGAYGLRFDGELFLVELVLQL